MEPVRMRNGHLVYTCCDPARYHMCHSFRIDYESAWETVEYVADKAYDFKDIGTLFADGISVSIMKHYDVPIGVIYLIAGIIFGLWLFHVSHKSSEKRE